MRNRSMIFLISILLIISIVSTFNSLHTLTVLCSGVLGGLISGCIFEIIKKNKARRDLINYAKALLPASYELTVTAAWDGKCGLGEHWRNELAQDIFKMAVAMLEEQQRLSSQDKQ